MPKTQNVRLVALGQGRQVYGTRRLTAGDEFEMPRQVADVLIRLGRAKLAPEASTPSPSPPPVSHETDEVPEDDELPGEAVADEPPRRPRGRPPIHGRYSKRTE